MPEDCDPDEDQFEVGLLKDNKEEEEPKSSEEIKDMVFDLLRNIRDPEKPQSLEELNVIYEEGIFIKQPTAAKINVVRVEFNPTVPHCSLATLIGLCIRIKLEREMPFPIKLDIFIKDGAHTTEHEINKQINDKERIAAAMENPNLREIVETCIKEED
ncbi:MIP18 family protein galla-1 [Euwallacea fornicatus]|uniref:MIP18 family protein galla-1 n=1 Tax=Euwallacea fornicatus TaxID=995702 RepID=UPI00338E8C31